MTLYEVNADANNMLNRLLVHLAGRLSHKSIYILFSVHNLSKYFLSGSISFVIN